MKAIVILFFCYLFLSPIHSLAFFGDNYEITYHHAMPKDEMLSEVLERIRQYPRTDYCWDYIGLRIVNDCQDTVLIAEYFKRSDFYRPRPSSGCNDQYFTVIGYDTIFISGNLSSEFFMPIFDKDTCTITIDCDNILVEFLPEQNFMFKHGIIYNMEFVGKKEPLHVYQIYPYLLKLHSKDYNRVTFVHSYRDLSCNQHLVELLKETEYSDLLSKGSGYNAPFQINDYKGCNPTIIFGNYTEEAVCVLVFLPPMWHFYVFSKKEGASFYPKYHFEGDL